MSSSTEQIKERLNIVDVISGYLKVEKAGVNYKARCPFHNEKTASFFISPSRQSYYCFGCGEKGDVFTFVEKFEGLDFKGALKALAERAGVQLEKFNPEAENKGEKERLFEIMATAAQFFEDQLSQNKEAVGYLQKRGISESSIQKWKLGLAQDAWRSLHDLLLSKGFQKSEMLEAGLIKKVPDENKYYDTFRSRIMFPICDSAGRTIAFSGRAIRADDKTPKYLNSPETKLFYKSEVLYGFDIAKSHIRKMDYAVLVEGQLDLIMSHQAGVLNTVASSGTALTELHLKKIKMISPRVIVAYDGDNAGEKAAQKAAAMALALGMEVKVASLDRGEDPASTVQADPEKWKKALREAEHPVDFALGKSLQENRGQALTKRILKNVLPFVALVASEMEQAQFIRKIAMKLEVPEETVWNDLKKVKKGETVAEEMEKNANSQMRLDRILAGLIFLEESRQDNISGLREKWNDLSGHEADQILESFESEKEKLVFEAEMLSTRDDLATVAKDVLCRMEIERLKAELKNKTALLDNKEISKEDETSLKTELEKIQRRLKELS